MLANLKAMLAYLTWTLTLLGAMAPTVGAGIKWDGTDDENHRQGSGLPDSLRIVHGGQLRPRRRGGSALEDL